MKLFKKSFIAFLCILCVFSVVACGKKSAVSKYPSIGVAASGNKFSGSGYSFYTPSDWVETSNNSCDKIVYNKSSKSNVPQSFNVVIESIGMKGKDFDASNYLEAAKKQFDKSGYTYGTESFYNVNGTVAATIEVVMGGNTNYKCLQTYLIHNSKAYILTYGAGDDYDQGLETAKSIIASFTFE